MKKWVDPKPVKLDFAQFMKLVDRIEAGKKNGTFKRKTWRSK